LWRKPSMLLKTRRALCVAGLLYGLLPVCAWSKELSGKLDGDDETVAGIYCLCSVALRGSVLICWRMARLRLSK
jgi:hypothetical protein